MIWWRRLKLLLPHKQRDRQRDLDEELRAHLDLAADDAQLDGHSSDQAAYTARRTLGNLTLIQEDTRAMWGWTSLERLAQDLRFTFRSLRKSPGFTTVAVLTLALGIGANTAIFSIVDGVLLRPLAYKEPDRLVAIQEVMPKLSHIMPELGVNASHFLEWQKQCKLFEQISLLDNLSMNLTSDGEPERLAGGRVSWNFFSMLRVQPRLGRSFLPEEDQPGRDHVVVISDSLWKRRFQGDPGIIGRSITLNNEKFEVVGVLPPHLVLPEASQLLSAFWKPFALRKEELSAIGDFNFEAIARLKPGVTRARALAELNAAQANIARQIPEKIELYATLTPLQEQITSPYRRGLLLLLGTVGVVLLIACVNIANLLLARGSARRQELAVRNALGAGRIRLLRQMLTESLALSLLGGILGVILAYWLLQALLANAPVDLPRLQEIHLDASVLLFALLLSVFTGVLFGILPAWRFSRSDPQEALKAGGRTAAGERKSGHIRELLVGLEVCLSTACLIGAVLLLNSFVRLLQVDKGFEAERIITLDLTLPETRYPDPKSRNRFFRSMIEALESVPGVSSIGISNGLPLSGYNSNSFITLDGTKTPLLERPIADRRCVNPHFFQTIRIPLRQGRIFQEADEGREVAVLSAKTANRLWPGQNPIGKQFRFGDEHWPLTEVVGIVGDIRGAGLEKEPGLTIYLPYWQRSRPTTSLVIRTTMEPSAIINAIRAKIRQLDRELPIPQFLTMEQIVSGSVAQRRFQMMLMVAFASITLLLAAIGVYGVISYSVAQRRNEIGIRMALGATRADVHRLIIHQGLRPVLIGLVGGLLGGLAVGRILKATLFGISPSDPLTFICAALLLLLVAASACYLPALRATKIDPMRALRYE